MQNICALVCENFFYPALALFREIVMHHCNSYKWPHQKGGGGHVPEMPTPRSTTASEDERLWFCFN